MDILFSMVIVFSIVAIMYLLVSALGLKDILPKTVSTILARLSATILVTAIPLALYDMSEVAYFGKVAALLFTLGLVFTVKEPVYGKAVREYRKRFGKAASEREWICKRCGELNTYINVTCIGCGKKNPEKEPKPDESWECKRCGRRNFLTDRNCTKCGHAKDGDKYTY